MEFNSESIRCPDPRNLSATFNTRSSPSRKSAAPPDLPSFSKFAQFPKEIRCIIWGHAALRRPRVIQILYMLDTKTWHASGDSCGGLPSIMRVSREARSEALKGYTRAFDTYLDLIEDTILISDPVFTIRETINAFMECEHAKQLHKVALPFNTLWGLIQTSHKFPTFCEGPAAILRKLEGLTHFTLVLSEDGQLDEYQWTEWIDDESEGYDPSDLEDFIVDMDDEDGDIETVAEGTEVHPEQTPAIIEVESQEIQEALRRLERLEESALERLSEGFVSEVGDLHFESPMKKTTYWEDWNRGKDVIVSLFEEEKELHPQWIRPKGSVMIVRYGLNRPGDFGGPIHLEGDYPDIVMENSECPASE